MKKPIRKVRPFQNKARVVLIVGFLGTGKTSLLKHIVTGKSDLSGTVLIINEFGKIGIDGSLIKKEDAEIIELTSGCICCTLAMDLRILLDKILKQYEPHTIFIEASGVADPRSLISIFNEEEIRSHILGNKTVTVIDAGFWEIRTIIGDIFHCQIDPADLILVNKVDLLPDDKVNQCLREVREMYPRSEVRPTVHCRIDLEKILWSDKAAEEVLPLRDHQKLHGSETAEESFETLSYVNSGTMDEDCFKRFIRELSINVFRVKGTVRFHNRSMMLNHVGGKSEWIEEDSAVETRLVFIGWKIKEEEILLKLKGCLLSAR